MSNKKVSSVEWYSNEIGKITALALSGKMTGLEWKYLQAKALEKAKAMHKEETINFAQTWSASCITKEHLEYFYNETFNHETN